MTTLPVVVTVRNASGLTTTANAIVNVSDTPVSLFTNQIPVQLAVTEGAGGDYELGMRFTSAASGSIQAIRYWKSASETGTHTGRIWSASGQLLASVVFTGESASGWQQKALATPLAIAAGTTYIVSVNINTHYVATSQGFSAAITHSGLTAPAGAGVFNSAAAAFPSSSFNNANYFRDVVVVAGAAPPVEPPPPPPPPMTGFPDASNTGVPAGTTLTIRPVGDVVLNVAGQVFEAQHVQGRVNVRANNVKIRRCKLDAKNEFFNIDAEGFTGLEVSDCDLINSGTGPPNNTVTNNGSSILSGGATILRNNISGQHHCISSNGGNLIQDNYMHSMRGTPSGHYECIYIGGGGTLGGDTIRHNTMFSFDTAVVFLKTDYGAVNNCTVDNNLMRQQVPVPVSGLRATSYTIYLDGPNMTGNQVTNNIMERGFFGYSSVNGNTPVWSNNRDYASGALIPLGS